MTATTEKPTNPGRLPYAYSWTPSLDAGMDWKIWHLLPVVQVQWSRQAATLLSWHGPLFMVTLAWMNCWLEVSLQKERHYKGGEN